MHEPGTDPLEIRPEIIKYMKMNVIHTLVHYDRYAEDWQKDFEPPDTGVNVPNITLREYSTI